jgi:Protein of unknown function (DUF2442)
VADGELWTIALCIEGDRPQIFSNDEVKRFDVTPYLERGIFIELKDIHYFNRVKPFFGGVQWLHEQDFSADTLYLESQADIDWQAMQQAG